MGFLFSFDDEYRLWERGEEIEKNITFPPPQPIVSLVISGPHAIRNKMGVRQLLTLVALVRAAGWTVPQQLARCRAVPRLSDGRRRAATPVMSSDSLSAEFQRLSSARSGTVFGDAPDLLRERKVERSWVLIFNPGQDDEGLYTLQGSETSEAEAACDGTYVLAFEQQEEASRFAMLLQAQGFDMPAATEWPAEQLSEFCSSTQFGLGFVPGDALLVPPQRNYFDESAFELTAKLQGAEEAYGVDGAEVRARLDRLFDL